MFAADRRIRKASSFPHAIGAADTSRCKLHAPRFVLRAFSPPASYNFLCRTLRSTTFIIPHCFSLYFIVRFSFLLTFVTSSHCSLHIQSAPCIPCIPGGWLPAEISISCIPPILLVDSAESLHNEFALGKKLILNHSHRNCLFYSALLKRSTGPLGALSKGRALHRQTPDHPALKQIAALFFLMP